jgi:hypothetical protein
LTALLGVATLAVTLAVYRPQLIRPWVERALTPRGGTASLSGIEVSLSPPALVLSGLSIAASPSDGGDLLRADHLRFELIPGRFFRGGPWLRHVEARGVNYERPRPRETEGPPDLSPLTRLFDIEDLSLTDARLLVAVPQGVLAVDGLRLGLAPGEAGVRAFNGSADLSFRAKGSPVFAAKLSARGTVTPEPALTVDLESASGRLELPWISGNMSGRTRLRLTRKNFRFEDLVLTFPQGRVNTGPRPAILPERIRLNAAGGATLDGREPSLEIRGLDIGGLLIARGRLSGPTIDKISGTLDGEIPRVERARTYWAPLLPGALADLELTGRLPWRLTLSGRRVAATTKLVQIGFRSPNGDAIGQNLAGTVDLEAYLTSRPRVKADLALQRGEVLWGTIYLDLAKDPLDLHVGGTRAGPGKYEELLIEGGLAGFGRLGIDGKARREGERWRHEGRLALRDVRLGPIFRTFLRDPLAASQPDLAGLEMEGAAAADLSFSGSGKAVDLDGTLRLRLSDLHRGGEPPLLSGLDIDLPVSYSMGAANPGRPRPSDAARWGRLRLEKARLAGQELGPLEIPAVLVPNRLYLGGTVETSLFGAKLALRRIQVDEPISTGFLLNMAARLAGLDLARVAGKKPLLEGHLGGLLDPVTIGRERMTAAGELTGDLFGGRLDVRRVTVERPFSAGREIGADMNVDRIDLDRFSAALGVGRITGRLSGSIKGLRIAYGQPVAFDLKMESVPAKGVSQSVSLKAVNSISLVGTGSALSGVGISLMATFFREFAYEKIGFECGLKNDVFTVRGLIHEDGVEYLVKRRLFTGIDVINGNPDNRIGFSDMLERAKRVTDERTN